MKNSEWIPTMCYQCKAECAIIARVEDGRLKDILDAKSRGAKLVVIDPIFTPEAAKADQWIPIRPSGDTAFLAGMIQHIIAQDQYDRDFVENWVRDGDFEKLKGWVADKTPEKMSAICDVPAATIKSLATEFSRETYHPAERAEMPVLEPEDRVTHFEEVQLGLTEEMVVEEAKRCLACASACIQACPYDVIQFDLKTGVSHKCNLCSDRTHIKKPPVCVEVCMTDAITFGEYGLVKQGALDEGRTIREELSQESVLYVK